MLIHLLWQNWVTLALILLLIHFATLATTNMLIATFTKILLKTFLFKMMSGHEDKIYAVWTRVSIIFGMFDKLKMQIFFWYLQIYIISIFLLVDVSTSICIPPVNQWMYFWNLCLHLAYARNASVNQKLWALAKQSSRSRSHHQFSDDD